jgi:serine protease Do
MKPISKWLSASALLGGLLAALFFALPPPAWRPSFAVESSQEQQVSRELAAAQDWSRAFTQVAKIAKPFVVSISSVKIVKQNPELGQATPPGGADLFGDDFFDRFFRQRIPREGLKQTGLGTGVIVSADGHILTNNHVVADADELTVRIPPNRDLTAKVVGTDPKTDVALIKIDAKDLQPAKLGDSDALEVGEWVLAMGNSFGLSETLTAGIVSAKGRANLGILGNVGYEDFIQTDAAINPGNSGGPLLNLRGEVVGINTAIFSRTGGSLGIGFAIPSNLARSVMESILREGRVVRGFLGVHIQDLTPELARSFSYKESEGAVVVEVEPNSPAAKAGLKEGDIITAIEGEHVKESVQLRNKVAGLRPGSQVKMDVFRGGKTTEVTARIAEQEGSQPPAQPHESTTNLGMNVKTLTPEMAKQLDQSEELKGVVVTAVEPGSIADKAGLHPRDIIVDMQGQSVADTQTFQSQMQENDRQKGVRLKVRRGNNYLYLFIPPVKNP